ISKRIGIGLLAGFLGVGLVTLAGQEVGGIGPGALPGVVIGLGGAFVWAVYTVGMRRFARHTVDPLVATALAALGAAIPLGLLAFGMLLVLAGVAATQRPAPAAAASRTA